MNRALFFSFIKTQARTIFSYAFGAVIYEWLIIWIYPSVANSSAMNQLLTSMPAPVLKALGVQHGIQGMGDFLGTEFYGLIFLLILGVFSITTAIQLVARLVDRGSMAYLLATPSSRSRVCITQASILLLGLLVISMCTWAGGLLGAAIFMDHAQLPVASFTHLNLTGFLLFSVIGGFAFLCSCIFNDEKRAIGTASAVVVVSYAIHLAATLANKLNWLNHLSIFSLFNPAEVIRGQFPVLRTELGLSLTTIVLLFIAVRCFQRRDLPL